MANYIESSLFECDGGWDGDHECIILYDVTLKVPVKGYPAGTKFCSVAFLNDKSIVEVYDETAKKPILTFKVKLVVDEEA